MSDMLRTKLISGISNIEKKKQPILILKIEPIPPTLILYRNISRYKWLNWRAAMESLALRNMLLIPETKLHPLSVPTPLKTFISALLDFFSVIL